MKKTLLCLALISILSLSSCSQESFQKQPDYSKYTGHMDFYAYAAASDGTYTIDDVTYNVGESFLTEEQFKMYKDAGLNIFFPQSVAKISATESERESSWAKVKPIVDLAVKSGLERTILYDEGLSWFALKDHSLIGTGEDQYENEDALDERVNQFVKLYATYPGVYGVIMADEPKSIWAQAYGEVYNSLKRVNKKYGYNLYIQYNLNPFILSQNVFENYYPHVEGTDEFNYQNAFIRYKEYIKMFMTSMKPDYIQYDSYPMRKGEIANVYLPCLQYVADVARDNNIDFHNVTQTFAMINNGTETYRKMTEVDAHWINNLLLGFGVDQISYFTYFTHGGSQTKGEFFVDDTAFVNNYGKKTYLYDIMKKVIAEDQSFANVYQQFDYVASDVVRQSPMNFPAGHLQYFSKDGEFTALKSYSVDKECAFISELYDKENGFYMYDAMNIVNPANKGSTTYETITLTFDEQYKYALVYRNAEPSYYRLDENHSLKVKAAPGEASFVIPFN